MPSPMEIKAGDLLIDLCQKEFGEDSQDHYKEDEKSSKVLAHLSAPFNPRYLSFTTTRGNSIYWSAGNKADVLNREWWTFKVRAHEGQHMWDWPWLKWVYGLPHLLLIAFLIPFVVFGKLWALACIGMLLAGLGIGYIFPRNKAWFFPWSIAGAAACVGIGIWKTQWATVWLGAGALCVTPALNWLGFAMGRAIAELRGYTISMACNHWRYGHINRSTVDWIVRHFTGPSYYFMLPWKWLATKLVLRQIKKIEDGRILKSPWANKVYAIMRETNIAPERY